MKIKLRNAIYLLSTLVFLTNVARTQEMEQTPMDTLATAVSKLQTDMELLKKIKVSGYIQAQFQVADSAGIGSFAGGDFAPNTDKRFLVRRGRLKVTYDNATTQYVLQVDATPTGVVIKDVYVLFKEPWTNYFSLQAGVFNRPFGFEVPYSSSMRESPERSRFTQTLFPGERDLGAKIAFQPPKTSKWNFLRIEGGMFNGTGTTANDFDFQKDFIGNIGINSVTRNEKINYGLRFSYYDGGYRQPTKFVYDGIESLSNGNPGFIVDSADSNKGNIGRRRYVGGDFQLNLDNSFGITSLRGEYIQGKQPGTSTSTLSPSALPATDTYIRNFNGAYFYFLQNLGPTKHQLIFKYDWYDPNSNVRGDDIGKAGSNLSGTDLKYTTIGIGWIYHWDANIRIMVYGDLVTNETSNNLSGFTKDIKDNVLTFRIQYKF